MAKILDTSPLEDGFRMVAEWEGYKRVWLLWPERPDNWRDNAIPAQKRFAEVANTISIYRNVTVGVHSKDFLDARALLRERISIEIMEYDDSWIRDTGPTFLVNDKGDVRAVQWDFNAWGGAEGGLYRSWVKDKLVAERVAKLDQIDLYRAPIILEGGSIHVDGFGTLVTTEECLLNKNRNPGISKFEVEEVLKNYCGTHKVIWLKRGLYNDETDGHVDNLFSFVRPGVGLLNWTDDESDPNYEVVREALSVLRKERDVNGNLIEIIKVPQPSPQFISKIESEGVKRLKGSLPRLHGDRLICSYINYYRDQNFVLLPIFGDSTFDEKALNIFEQTFPALRIIPIYSREIVLGGGGIHCITLGQP